MNASAKLYGSHTFSIRNEQYRNMQIPSKENSEKLAVIIITLNEAGNIRQCLESVAFANFVYVLDSGSSDRTVDIAREMGAFVSVNTDWQGFGVQKNRVLETACTGGCDWILSLDADERVSNTLQLEIKAAMVSKLLNVYAVSRLSSYCGATIYHSGWQPDWVTRFFRLGYANFSNDIIHEKLQTLHPTGKLYSQLIHESFKNFESVLDKVNRYSTAGALILQKKQKKTSFASAVIHGLWAFIRTYFFKLGFLDGKMGFVLAFSNAEGTFYRYLKSWLMSQKIK